MKRRSRAGSKASKARGREALKTKRRDASRTASSSAPVQDTEVARLARELNEALERQAATSEVLEVISGSPGDLQPVFAAMLENAVCICDANFGNIYRWDGVKIGVLNDQSSVYADSQGIGSVIAARLAVEDYAKNLGLTVEVVYADHQNKVDIGASIALLRIFAEVRLALCVECANAFLRFLGLVVELERLHAESADAGDRIAVRVE